LRGNPGFPTYKEMWATGKVILRCRTTVAPFYNTPGEKPKPFSSSPHQFLRSVF